MAFKFIYFDEKILGGKPIIKGSRISVEFIMEWLVSGGTVKAFYKEYMPKSILPQEYDKLINELNGRLTTLN